MMIEYKKDVIHLLQQREIKLPDKLLEYLRSENDSLIRHSVFEKGGLRNKVKSIYDYEQIIVVGNSEASHEV